MKNRILVASDIAATRTELARIKRLRLVGLVIIYGSFGLVAGVLVYFIPSSHEAGLAVSLGGACAILSGFPAALHWSRRHKGMLRELNEIESDILAGKLIYSTEFDILTRNAA